MDVELLGNVESNQSLVDYQPYSTLRTSPIGSTSLSYHPTQPVPLEYEMHTQSPLTTLMHGCSHEPHPSIMTLLYDTTTTQCPPP